MFCSSRRVLLLGRGRLVGATVIRMADVSLTGRKIQTLELKDYRGEVAVKLDVLVGIRRRGSGAPADPGHRRRGHAGRIDVRRLASFIARTGPPPGVVGGATDWNPTTTTYEGRAPEQVARDGGGGGGDMSAFVTHNPLAAHGGGGANSRGSVVIRERTSSAVSWSKPGGGGGGGGAGSSSTATSSRSPSLRGSMSGGHKLSLASLGSSSSGISPSRAPIVSASSGRSLTAGDHSSVGEPSSPVAASVAATREVMAVARRARVLRASRTSAASMELPDLAPEAANEGFGGGGGRGGIGIGGLAPPVTGGRASFAVPVTVPEEGTAEAPPTGDAAGRV